VISLKAVSEERIEEIIILKKKERLKELVNCLCQKMYEF
jgi:hypothetical protein